jgi:hypothetical protein
MAVMAGCGEYDQQRTNQLTPVKRHGTKCQID